MFKAEVMKLDFGLIDVNFDLEVFCALNIVRTKVITILTEKILFSSLYTFQVEWLGHALLMIVTVATEKQ